LGYELSVLSADNSESFQSGRAVIAGRKPKEAGQTPTGGFFAQRNAMDFSPHFEERMLEKAKKCSMRH
jgi:hypothetical protein